MRTLLQDLRYGLRAMGRSPGLTAVAVLSLALGIGANTAIFSLVNALILRTLPVQDPHALVLFGPGDGSGTNGGFPSGSANLFSYPLYREMQQKNQVFSGVAAVNSFPNDVHGTVGKSGNLEPMQVQLVSGTYFNVLGVNSIVGRVLSDADDQALGGHPVAVISYGWWKTRFSRDPSMVGKTLTIGSTVYTIVGVMPPGFFGTNVGQSPNLWIPLSMTQQVERGPHKLDDKFYQSLDIIARLKPGVSREQASANVNLLFNQILHEYAGPKPTQKELEDIKKARIELNSAATGISFVRLAFGQPLLMLMAIVGLVLLIACANIANLLLARATTRHREIAVRMALGAGRPRLIRQLLTESLVLAAFGGCLGVLFASWASRFLLVTVSAGPQSIPLKISLDTRVLGFTLVLSVATAILFGTLPALRATRVELVSSLKDGRGAITVQGRNLLAKALIVSQVALSLVLLIGAGLFLRSLVNLMDVNTGFNKQNVLLLHVDTSATGYTHDVPLVSLYQKVEQRVGALPGVRAASFSTFSFGEGGWRDRVWVQGRLPGQDRNHSISSNNAVGPGFFAAMGLPILEGRSFGPEDTATSPRVAIINETMARRIFPGGSPIGKRFGMNGPEHSNDIEVVGVVRDAKYQDLQETPWNAAYFPYAQYIPSWGIGLYLNDFEIRFSGDPRAVVPEVRSAFREVNDKLPITDVTTLAEQVDQSITQQRLVAQLSIFFGLLAVFLACIGIYGITSYAVTRRTSEIGIRMALGAQQVDVLRMVMREIVLLVGAGLAIGVPVALASDRWVASMIFGIKPTDPITVFMAVLLLLAVAAFAGYLPARRASKVDPMTALRYE